jgi:hypothetical protein
MKFKWPGEKFVQPRFFFPINLLQFFNPHPPSRIFIRKQKKFKGIVSDKNFSLNYLFIFENYEKKNFFIKKKKTQKNKKKLEFFIRHNHYFFPFKSHKYLIKVKPANLFYPLNLLKYYLNRFSKYIFFRKILNHWILFWGNSFLKIKIKRCILEKNFKKFLNIFL